MNVNFEGRWERGVIFEHVKGRNARSIAGNLGQALFYGQFSKNHISYNCGTSNKYVFH